ncbi:MAG: FHA domain-containing protein [Chloroflexi bacterium]|nr:FHA domain-containing protein [Chloroflexota bacterium]
MIQNPFDLIREYHKQLLERTDQSAISEEEQANIVELAKDFLTEISKASAAISDTRDRSFFSSLQRYWASYIYDHTGELLSTSLQPFIGTDTPSNNSDGTLPIPETVAKKPKKPNAVLENLKRALQTNEPVMVDKNGKYNNMGSEIDDFGEYISPPLSAYGGSGELPRHSSETVPKKPNSTLEDLKRWLHSPTPADENGEIIASDEIVGNEPVTTHSVRISKTWYRADMMVSGEAIVPGLKRVRWHSWGPAKSVKDLYQRPVTDTSGWFSKILNKLGLRGIKKSQSITSFGDMPDIVPLLVEPDIATLLVEDLRHLTKKSVTAINQELEEATKLKQIRKRIIRQNFHIGSFRAENTRMYISYDHYDNHNHIVCNEIVIIYEISDEAVKGIFRLIDVGSHNGTFVNGKRQENCILNNNDIITVGKTRILFKRIID